MATIFDIAEKAGVSITTVSRALNGYSDVNEKTRQRIIAIAESLNYYPSAAARSLQGKKTNTIAFAPLLDNHIEAEPFFKEFVGVLALTCFKHDLSLHVAVADSAGSAEETYRELAGTGRVDGIILADIRPNDERIALLKRLEKPFVAFGRTSDYADRNYPFVDVDGAAGIKKVVSYLYEQGHRRIAYLSGPRKMSYALHRYEGYRQGLTLHGLVQDERLNQADLQQAEQAEQAIARLLALAENEQPTAIIADNDDLALHLVQALRRAGREIGRGTGQIAITGFDDLPFAAYLHPSLTTLQQPNTLICNVLLDLLVILLKKEEAPLSLSSQKGLIQQFGPQQILVEPELIKRDSA